MILKNTFLILNLHNIFYDYLCYEYILYKHYLFLEFMDFMNKENLFRFFI